MKKSKRQGYNGESWKNLENIIALGHSRENVFNDWLDLMLSAHLSLTDNIARKGIEFKFEAMDGKYEARYLDIVKRYPSNQPQGKRPCDYFAAAYHALLDEIAASDGDPLGDIYMREITYGEHGQFFTPKSVADMMTQMLALSGEKRESVCDPSCGSGIMLIAAGKHLKPSELVGVDLDSRCAKMCALNFAFRGLSGVVFNGDTLTGKMYTVWKIQGMHIYEDDDPQDWTLKEVEKLKQASLGL